jgi:hypothetical protein
VVPTRRRWCGCSRGMTARKLALVAVIAAGFVLAVGCSTGPDPDRLKTPSQLTSADSCQDVIDILEAMDDGTLWSEDLSTDEFLLVWDRDIDDIKLLYDINCPSAFQKCSDAARFSARYNPEFEAPSSVIYFLMAEDFLNSECD